MDGLQGKISQSLQFRLSIWLSLVILGVALIGGAFSFMSAFQEANDLQDDQLKQVAALVIRYRLPITLGEVQDPVPMIDPESRLVVQMLPAAGNQGSASSGGTLALPSTLLDGMQTVNVGDEPWRVFVKTVDKSSRIAVAQQTVVRDETARDSALQTLMPFGILIPILLFLVAILIRQMFKPVKILSANLDSRSEHDIGPISQLHLPSEIMPFVVAINRLLVRTARSIAMQRRFVADAAHELRSPLTALSLQAEQLQAADMSAQARDRLLTLQSGLRRTRMLVDQLLTLARVQEPANSVAVPVSLQHVFRQVLEDLMPLAEEKHIDLGVVDDTDAWVAVQEMDINILLRNLVDNAIRYTPDGGRIDLSVRMGELGPIVQIDDSGPGIPDEERGRVFDPFYRVLGNDEVGSGLGLSIVKTIADRLGISVSLGSISTSSPAGLRVIVQFNMSRA